MTGLVRKPDQLELESSHDVHVLDAIAMAGGESSPVADKVLVIRRMEGRPEPVVIRVSLADAKRNGRENIRLQSGDLVSVEQTPSTLVVDTITRFLRVAVGVSGSATVF